MSQPERTPTPEREVGGEEYVDIERPDHLKPHGPSPLFGVLVYLFECVRDERKLDQRRIFLERWFKKWRLNVGPDLYPAMRLLLPQKDRERATYGLKETMLAKSFIAAFGLNEKKEPAQRLLKWKQPTTTNKSAGDFPTTVYEVISTRSSVDEEAGGTLTIERVNEMLDEISRDREKKHVARIMREFTETCSAKEIAWIVRIILKDLNISVKENTVFAVFHPDAMDLFNACSDLKRICYQLYDPSQRLAASDKTIHLFRPFQPMLCGRSKGIEDAWKRVRSENGFIMEEKLDGERMQLHKRGNQYFYCSRKGKNYTYLYGNDVGSGSLTPYIHAHAFDPKIQDCILDGEMLVWDPSLEKYLAFGSLKTSAGDKNPGPDKPRPCYKVFDILYVNISGHPNNLTNTPIVNRKKVLKGMGLFKEIKGRFEFSLEKMGRTHRDVEGFLTEIVEQRGEGLVIKSLNSKYILGERGDAWVKVKPEYMDDMGETVDVLVVAANWGTGRRGGRVSTLICAVRDDVHKTPDGGTRYITFVRIGSGLSLEDYEWINDRKWVEFDKSKPLTWLKVARTSSSEDKGDVYILPQDSFIVTVKAASIHQTDMYGAGMTMRFPRCRGIRRDLELEDVMTFSQLMDFQSGKKRKAADAPPSPTKKKRPTTKKQTVQLSDAYRGTNVKDVERKSDIFDDLKFLVVGTGGTNVQYQKDTLEKLIVANGGEFCQVLKGNDDAIMIYGGTKKITQVASAIKRGDVDIIKPEWLIDSDKKQALVKLNKKYFFHATHSSKESPEYEAEEDEDGEDTEDEEALNEAGPSKSRSHARESSPHAEWLQSTGEEDEEKSEERVRKINLPDDQESDTEDEAEFEKVDYDAEDEDWMKVDKQGGRDEQAGFARSMSQLEIDGKEASPDHEMGDAAAMEYDTSELFKHLCFYLDTPDNARKNGLKSGSSDLKEAIAESLAVVGKQITQNGGTVTNDLSEAKLTHVVLDKRDTSRRVDLIRRTAQPKRRRIVQADFIKVCLQEGTLVDEDAF